MKRTALALFLSAAVCTAAPFAALAAGPAAAAAAQEPIRAVYHINEVDKARGLLANVRNHLRDDPSTKIVVIANGGGIEFLLKDAMDKGGMAYAPALEELVRQGVAFKVCRNTLAARKLTDAAVAEDVGVVQAGVGEIARLQAREGYVYLKP
jgi:intracellular sulfur oxidation DsrE/DsrF family protein